jgi:hypothetical protein
MFKRMILVVCCYSLGSAAYARAMDFQNMSSVLATSPLVRNMTIAGTCGFAVPAFVNLFVMASGSGKATPSMVDGGFFGTSGGLVVHMVIYAFSKNYAASGVANILSGLVGTLLGCAVSSAR